MPIAYYITHPQVRIDADVPVPGWRLSDVGRARAVAMLDQPWVGSIGRIVSSAERKAIETAEILAGRLHLAVEVRERTHENDRSATGFLPPPEFEAVARSVLRQAAREHPRLGTGYRCAGPDRQRGRSGAYDR